MAEQRSRWIGEHENYRRPLARLDRLHHGTADGEVGRLEQRLRSFGELQTYVAGNWGEGSEDLHSLVQSCAEARVAHICRSTGRQESEHLLGTIVGQYRRLISTCAVRAQAMCILARVGIITPAAREAGGDEVGGADEGGEESTVDGLPPGTWLGQERPMSWPVKQHVDV